MSRINLALVLIDYKKKGIQYGPTKLGNKLYKISDEVIKFIEKTMKNWRVKLTAGGKSLDVVKIQKGIFQGDVLSPLLFVIAIMLLNHIHAQ